MSSCESSVFSCFRGRGYPQDDAVPNFFLDSKSSILGLLNEVLFVNELLCDVGQN